MNRCAAVVILYDPDETVPTHINSYAHFFDKVYVIDNSEKPQPVHQELAKIPNASLHADLQNAGIAQRLNEACRNAINEGFDWLLTMDQDSFFEEDMIACYIENFNRFPDKDSVAQFGVNNKEEGQKVKTTDSAAYHEADMMITSGSLLNLAAFQKIGDFDTAYFIDQVDNDYCVRAKLGGFRLISFPNIFLTHRFGEKVKRSSIKTLYLVKKYKVVHSPLRCYYIQRNLLYFEKKFREHDLPVVHEIVAYTKNYLRQNLYYNGAMLKTFRYLRKARSDFRKGQMGKIEMKDDLSGLGKL